MEIKRPTNSFPTAPVAAETSGPAKAGFAAKLEAAAPTAAPRDAAAVTEQLLDRASERVGGLPDSARAALRAQLDADPFFQARLKGYLESQGE